MATTMPTHHESPEMRAISFVSKTKVPTALIIAFSDASQFLKWIEVKCPCGAKQRRSVAMISRIWAPFRPFCNVCLACACAESSESEGEVALAARLARRIRSLTAPLRHTA